MNISGKIELKVITNGTGKKGQPYTRAEFTINGKKYSTFDKDIIANFNEGQEVEIELKQNGAYLNMTSMRLLDKSPQVSPSSLFPAELIEQLKRIADALEVKNGNNKE